MRKEISKVFKEKKTVKRFFWLFGIIVFFIVINGFFIYFLNPDNYYFFVVKNIIPYPAFIIGNKMVTFSSFEDKVSTNEKIYEIAYRVNFNSGTEGKKNLDLLKNNTQEEIIDRIIMESLLKTEGTEVSSKDVKNEYESIVNNISSDKEILNILKYSSGIKDSDIKDRIYQNLLTESVKNDFLYNLKAKVILIKPDNPDKDEDWKTAYQKSQDIYNSIKQGNSSFDAYYALYGDKNDVIVQNSGKEYYFAEEMPKEISDVFYDLKVGEVNEPIKSANGYYIFDVSGLRGYFKGSYDDFMKEQKKKVRILSFLR